MIASQVCKNRDLEFAGIDAMKVQRMGRNSMTGSRRPGSDGGRKERLDLDGSRVVCLGLMGSSAIWAFNVALKGEIPFPFFVIQSNRVGVFVFPFFAVNPTSFNWLVGY